MCNEGKLREIVTTRLLQKKVAKVHSRNKKESDKNKNHLQRCKNNSMEERQPVQQMGALAIEHAWSSPKKKDSWLKSHISYKT